MFFNFDFFLDLKFLSPSLETESTRFIEKIGQQQESSRQDISLDTRSVFWKKAVSKIIFNLVNAEHFSELFGFDSQLHVLFLFFVSHKMFSDDSKKPTAGTELVLAKEGNPEISVSC